MSERYRLWAAEVDAIYGKDTAYGVYDRAISQCISSGTQEVVQRIVAALNAQERVQALEAVATAARDLLTDENDMPLQASTANVDGCEHLRYIKYGTVDRLWAALDAAGGVTP